MIRRRRPVREIAFSFDSFLDVVANVVGIIIRLILVVWVGARSYTSMTSQEPKKAAEGVAVKALPEPSDPLQNEIARHRQELAAAQARLVAQLRQAGLIQACRDEAEKEVRAVSALGERLKKEEATIERAIGAQRVAHATVALTLEQIRQKEEKLREEILRLEKMPRLKKAIHYRTPVSAPVDSEEVLFECRHGRVTHIEIAALMTEVGRSLDEKGRMLRERRSVEDTAGPIGSFRLHYEVDRIAEGLEAELDESAPASATNFRYGLSGWQLEPVHEHRGENEQAALADRSMFRRVVDSLDPRQAAVTIFVYPDSFALYRKMRDYLYDHDVVVAGRPLPDGIPITCSRKGSRSRGQ